MAQRNARIHASILSNTINFNFFIMIAWRCGDPVIATMTCSIFAIMLPSTRHFLDASKISEAAETSSAFNPRDIVNCEIDSNEL